MSTVPEILAAAFWFAAPAGPDAAPCPPGTRCAVSGQPIAHGYPLRVCWPSSLSDAPEIFRGGGRWISPAAAACLGASCAHADNRASRSLIAVAGRPGLLPMIARDSARAQDRPCWSELVRQLWRDHAGATAVLVLSTSTKRRVWPGARVGTIGATTPIYVHDDETPVSACLTVDWPALLACLDLVESIYAAGVPKATMAESVLFIGERWPLADRLRWERALRPWRARPEFIVARLIAQKPEESH